MYSSDASMAATVDSGNETLFSDDSSCDLVMSPSACEADVSRSDDNTDIPPPRVAPPKIQPYSGVLEKGKIVIRPIAFKPVGMTPAARFGVAGERYGSTPILTRPGSHLVHYGSSSDLRLHHHHHHHHHSTNSNYSLDRKLLSSASSSPPLAMASLTSLPHKLINYDSMESVRKSPSSTVDSNTNKSSSYCLSGTGGGSLLDLTPSPSDSGVSELEAALRDRDSELAYLRQTMEHNEQVIFRVYQEKERVWERELRRMKSVHENRLRASAQKALKLEQMLMMQTYQLQQDKKRLCVEAQRASTQVDQLREEVDALRTRLEETEWSLCQKTGEISLLKTQLKDSQSEQTTKGHELLQLRGEFRDVKENLERREKEVQSLRQEAKDRDAEIERLRAEVKSLNVQLRESTAAANHRQEQDAAETERLKAEVRELREELSEVAMSEYEGVEAGRSLRSLKHLEYTDDVLPTAAETAEDIEIQRLNGELPEPRLSAHHCAEMERLQEEMVLRRKDFDQERVTWAQEKEKVLRYQRQLQLNYVQMFRRTRALEAEVENLTLELELNAKAGMKKPMSLDMSQTVEL